MRTSRVLREIAREKPKNVFKGFSEIQSDIAEEAVENACVRWIAKIVSIIPWPPKAWYGRRLLNCKN